MLTGVYRLRKPPATLWRDNPHGDNVTVVFSFTKEETVCSFHKMLGLALLKAVAESSKGASQFR